MTLAGGALAVLLGGVLLVANCPEADLESPVGAASSLESSGDGEGTGAPTDGTSAPDLGDHGAADQATQPPTEPPEPVFTIEPAPELPIRSVLAEFSLDLEDAQLDDENGTYTQTLEDGRQVVLTLDTRLQQHLEGVVARYDEPAETVVAIEPGTGRILAWVEDVDAEQAPTEHPLLNAEPYAASVFKVISAGILLSTNAISPSDTMCVPPGHGDFEPSALTPDADRDTRCLDLTQAMAHSANVFFARHIRERVPRSVMQDGLGRFGFNAEIPFILEVPPSEARVPADDLERARMGAGLRHSHLTPLHGAMIAGAIANGGSMMMPSIIQEVRAADGEILYQHVPAQWRQVMGPEAAAELARVMSATTTSGTARQYFAERSGWPDGLTVAGKTGTLSNRAVDGTEPDQLLTYSWFIGFAPIEDASIAVAGLVYNPERWYIKGAYLASEAVIQHWRTR